MTTTADDTFRAARPLSGTGLAAWLSGITAYGGAVGVLNMRAYWSAFSIDPFQFAGATDLAWVGLAAVGISLISCFVGLLAGGWIGEHLNENSKIRHWGPRLALFAVIAFMIGILIWLPASIWLVIGMFATWIVGALLLLSPFSRPYIRSADTIMAISVAIAFLPAMATFTGLQRAESVLDISKGPFVSRQSLPGLTASGQLKLAGRLGDTYILVQLPSKSVSLVPAHQQLITLQRESMPYVQPVARRRPLTHK